MRLPVLLPLAVLLLTACVREPLLPGTPRFIHEPAAGGRKAGGDPHASTPEAEPGGHVWLTAVRYPDGFDWEQDTCAVEGTVWIDLYRDLERVLSVPAGASVHPDMHRFTGGHLYSDASTDSETVVRRDGEELFRFPGRESLRGFLVREDGVHTLGQDRDGNGFTLRVDGRTVLRSETGTVFGTLDGTGPGGLDGSGEDDVFSCRIPSEKGFEYRVMQGAEVLRSLPATDGVDAFGFVGGKVCRVMNVRRRTVLEVDGKETPMDNRTGEVLLWCRMLSWGDDVVVLACVSGIEKRRTFLQSAAGWLFMPVGNVGDCLTGEGRMGWTETDGEGNLLRVCLSEGGAFPVAKGMRLAAGSCARLAGGHLYMALTGRGGVPNRFQTDAESVEVPFNGYFTSVTVE